MHKRTFLLAAVAATLAFGAAGAAWAGGPIGGLTIKGGCNPSPDDPCPHKSKKVDFVTVDLNLTKPETWVYDPVKGTLSPTDPELAAKGEVINPVTGIGAVVKKNPGGGGASKIEPNKAGGYDLPEKLENGLYDLVFTIPSESLNVKTPYKGVDLTFTLVKTDDGIFDFVTPPGQGDNGRGAGSPKANGF